MMGQLFVYPTFLAICIAGISRPWIGLIGFYGFVLLEPQWNWRWSIPADFQFQKFIAASVIIGWALQGFRVPFLARSAKQAVICLSAFLAVGFLSTTQSIDPQLSAFYMSNMWKIVLFAVMAVILLDSPDKIWIAIVVSSIAQGYSAIRINEQYFQDGFSLYAYRAWGTKGDNNLYSNLTVPLIACSIAACIYSDRLWLRLTTGAIAILQIHQIMLLDSRGAMLAAVGMGFLILWVMPKNSFTIRSTVFTVIITVLLAGPSVVREFRSSFESGENRDSSAESRFQLWKAGARITKDNALLGVGPYAGQRLVPSYYQGGLNATHKGLHNLLFEISTGFGIPAAILYFLYFLIPWWNLVRLKWAHRSRVPLPKWYGAAQLAVIAGIPGYLAGAMFSSGALSESPYLLASIGLATLSVAQVESMREQDAEPGSEGEQDSLAEGH
ncbi:O-antigen ligase family protein [Roseimaritima ulvae]|uniref:O-Antigen ligase n=1 Tax=Roseimaritima ulvae TaxID=980254 RepID=A0A5B9QXG4_9BACT|nr:O-antigen ligase family protein [Roseimaritima ulvae]QEG42500.1 O-Antigen ligase [Roseimaritima ulvae]